MNQGIGESEIWGRQNPLPVGNASDLLMLHERLTRSAEVDWVIEPLSHRVIEELPPSSARSEADA
jgi:hypothetical protein